jgi:hypothetical protein
MSNIFIEIFKNKNSSYSDFSEVLIKNGSRNIFIVSLITLIFNITIHFLINYFSDTFFLIHILLTNTILAFCFISGNLGIIPCARYILIVSPGFIQYLVYYFSDDTIRIAFLGNDFLNASIFKNVASISTIAGASSLLGFSCKVRITQNISNYLKQKYHNFRGYFFFFFIIFAIIYALSAGDSLLSTGSYGNSESEGSSVKIGTLNVFYFYFISIFFVLSSLEIKLNKISFILYALLFYATIVFIALRGVRQDSIGVALSIISFVYFLRNPKINRYYAIMVLFVLAWLGSVLTGILRADFSIETLSSIFIIFVSTFFKNIQGYVALNLDTASMTIGTLNVIPFKIQEQGYLLGSSYFDWIPRTLPAFIYENRPLDLAFQMNYNGEWFGWGGIHEVAEAYWNFGIIGVVIVPFFISLFINLIGNKFISSKSLYSAIPIVWLIMLPRYIWYQSFAFYKSTLVLVLLVFIIQILSKFILGSSLLKGIKNRIT